MKHNPLTQQITIHKGDVIALKKGRSSTTESTVQAVTTDRVIEGRLHMTTEARCPFCSKTNVYKHCDSHYSLGQWYGCKHLKSFDFDQSGFITGVGFVGGAA